MECAEKLRELILSEFSIFSAKNVAIGSIDTSRYDGNVNYCVIIPETSEIAETDLEGFSTETKFTVSMLFRGAKHSELVERMERTASRFQKLLFSDYSLGESVTDITPGTIKYFYDCGTVDSQATGLDIELTIKESRTLQI